MQKFLSQWYDQPHSTPPFSFQYNYTEFSESRELVAHALIEAWIQPMEENQELEM